MYPEFPGPLQVFCRLTGAFSGMSAQKYLLPGLGTVHPKAFPRPCPHPFPAQSGTRQRNSHTLTSGSGFSWT